MDEKTLDAIKAVLSYLWADESKDFEVSDEPENHIFRHVLQLESTLKAEYKRLGRMLVF